MHQTHMDKVSFLNRDVTVVEHDDKLVINAGKEWWPYKNLQDAQAIAALLIELSEELHNLEDLRWLGFTIFKRVKSMKERSNDTV